MLWGGGGNLRGAFHDCVASGNFTFFIPEWSTGKGILNLKETKIGNRKHSATEVKEKRWSMCEIED